MRPHRAFYCSFSQGFDLWHRLSCSSSQHHHRHSPLAHCSARGEFLLIFHFESTCWTQFLCAVHPTSHMIAFPPSQNRLLHFLEPPTCSQTVLHFLWLCLHRLPSFAAFRSSLSCTVKTSEMATCCQLLSSGHITLSQPLFWLVCVKFLCSAAVLFPLPWCHCPWPSASFFFFSFSLVAALLFIFLWCLHSYWWFIILFLITGNLHVAFAQKTFFFLFTRRSQLFPVGSDSSVSRLFSKVCRTDGLFTVSSNYMLSRSRKYHRPKRSSAQRQPTCSHFLLLLMAEQRLQQNNPHAYQRIMHPSPPLHVLLNGAHTQQAFHPSTMSYLAFSHSLVSTVTPTSPSDYLCSPVQHAWVAAWRWRS